MRGVLSMSWVILLAVVALDLSTRGTPRRGAPGIDATGTPRALDIRVFSTWSRDLEPLVVDGKIRADAIVVGEHFQARSPLPGVGPRGLSCVTIRPDGSVGRYEILDLAGSGADRDRFLARVEDAPYGMVLALGGCGSLRLDDGVPEEVHSLLARAFRRLGSRADPTQAPDASWAMITLRLEDGWRMLAESWSPHRAVALAFSVEPDPSRYRDHPGRLVMDPATGG